MKKGYTLIESLIALTIIMIVLITFLNAYPVASKSINRLKDQSNALYLCKNEIEKIKSDKNIIQSIIGNQNIKEIQGFQIISTATMKKEDNLILYTIIVEVNKQNINPIILSTKILYSE